MFQWRSAKDWVDDIGAFLFPPQIYELIKLEKFRELNDLKKFVHDVDSNGCQQFIPVMVKTTDGKISILPGKNLIKMKIFFLFMQVLDVQFLISFILFRRRSL